MLAKGLVQPSKSEWVSQPVMVKKVRDGVVLDEKRPCWDYRFVNECIRGDAFPLPLPENMFDALQGSRIFSKLDLTKGFWQIPIDSKPAEPSSPCRLRSDSWSPRTCPSA